MSNESSEKIAIAIENGDMSYNDIIELLNNEWGELLGEAMSNL
jgi:hypothetical protein